MIKNKKAKKLSLKKLLLKHLGETRAKKYLQVFTSKKYRKNEPETLVFIYQEAVKYLSEGEMTKCLNYIILGIQLDKNDISLLDLCKTIALGLNQTLLKGDIIKFSQKYSYNLKEARKILKSALKELEQKMSKTKVEVAGLETELHVKTTAFQLLKRSKLSKQLDGLRNELYELQADSEVSKIELYKAQNLMRSQEYAIVMGILIKYCVLEE